LLFVPIGQARSDPADCHHPVERIVGNIVDVTKLIVLGRGTGQTGLLIFDDAGKSLLEATVLVTPARQGAVTIHRGVNGTTLSCNPRCSDEGNGAPAPAAGAGKAP
jgi:hypothetical protein